jgi:hypothetical protein
MQPPSGGEWRRAADDADDKRRGGGKRSIYMHASRPTSEMRAGLVREIFGEMLL